VVGNAPHAIAVALLFALRVRLPVHSGSLDPDPIPRPGVVGSGRVTTIVIAVDAQGARRRRRAPILLVMDEGTVLRDSEKAVRMPVAFSTPLDRGSPPKGNRT
jgi:hypothetical protein